MRTVFKIPAVALASLAMAGQALASGVCASPGEAMALKTAALQQELMVAALYCDEAHAYNRFVISYRRELQDSDAALLGYFQRAGLNDYNAYKTALANNFSLASLRSRDAYCASAEDVFGRAFDPRNGSLASFVAAQSVSGSENYPACGQSGGQAETVAGGSSAIRLARGGQN
jgi:hypothetical protein